MTQSEKADITVKLIRHVTMVGFWINALLVVLKLTFGYWGHSDALVADGYHSLSDFATDFMVLFFVGIAYKKADKAHPYGHGKFETIASLLIAMVLGFVALGIGYEGAVNIVKAAGGEVLPRPDVWTLVIAAVSIAAKEFCYRYTIRRGRSVNSPSLIANAWHHRSDAISSVATLAGVGLSLCLGERWRIMDPIASVLIGVFILISAIQIVRPAINELLEKSIPPEQLQKIYDIIKSVPGVRRVHNLRCRYNGHSLIIDVNVHVDPTISVYAGHNIATAVETSLRNHLGSDLIMYVHIEPGT